MHNIRYILLISALLISAQGLSQNKELVQVVVGNEGNFGTGNATLTHYDVESGTATDGVFLDANSSGIGDVVQSTAWIDGKIYVVVNNSQKVVVIDPQTFQQTGQISFGENASPRHITKVTDTKAYVSDLYGSVIYVINLDDYSVSETTIPTGLNANRIVEHDGYAYVSNSGFGADSTIFKIDVAADAVVDTFFVSRGPSGMKIASDGTLWVVCTGYSGDYDDDFNLILGTSRPGGVHAISLESGEETSFAELPSAGSNIALNESEGKVYVNTGGVRAFDIETEEFETDTLKKGNFYAMAYDEVSADFYLADAKDFSSSGEVIIYSELSGEEISFEAGIIPSSFLFVYDDMINTSSEPEERIAGFELSQNYPNPFNPTTNIRYTLSKPGHVKLEVFNIKGQKVAELVNRSQTAGAKSVRFDASELSSGIYIYRIATASGSQSKKMMLIK